MRLFPVDGDAKAGDDDDVITAAPEQQQPIAFDNRLRRVFDDNAAT